MLVLFKTTCGFAVFKLLKEETLGKSEKWFKEFMTAEKASEMLQLKHTAKFEAMGETSDSTITAMEGKLPEKIIEYFKWAFLEEPHEKLVVGDEKIYTFIRSNLKINCICDSSIIELQSLMNSNLEALLGGEATKELTAMSPGVAHGLSRDYLKNLDKLIVQGLSAINELDKAVSNYFMRCKEWYSWHFPELSSIVLDNSLYVRTVLALGNRKNAATTDLSSILSEDVEAQVKYMADISIGADMAEVDLATLKGLCEDVLETQKERDQLLNYLKNRMAVIAPNITTVDGEMVGAQLLAHAGSLEKLSKHPSSTVQIFGVEKKLTKDREKNLATLKYDIISKTKFITQCKPELRGKMSRMLAAKISLASRLDAFGAENSDVGLDYRDQLERTLKMKLEEGRKSEKPWKTASGKKSHAKKFIKKR